MDCGLELEREVNLAAGWARARSLPLIAARLGWQVRRVRLRAGGGNCAAVEADIPLQVRGTIWDPATPWVRGKDRPLDAFVEFFDNYPRKHLYDIATQAPTMAGALNNVAGIVISHKNAAYKALQATKDQLSRGGHMLGGAYHKVLFFHIKDESASDVDADSATIKTTAEYLRTLNQQTQESINAQAKIIAQVTKALDRVSDNATKTVNALPGGHTYMQSPLAAIRTGETMPL